jgi:NAD(P)-dependent dehydrogenase (short-subunit alcohol dehydrogenase family)
MSQVWLITGTSSGLGHELARAVLGRGDKVIATARQLDRLSSLKELGAATLQLDVTAPQEELNRKAEEAIAVYGRIDILVNNAGYVQFGTIEETRYDSISSFFWITSRI